MSMPGTPFLVRLSSILPSDSAPPVYGKPLSPYEQITSNWSAEEARKAVSHRFLFEENIYSSFQEGIGSLRQEFEYLLEHPEHNPDSSLIPYLLKLNRTCQLFAGSTLYNPNNACEVSFVQAIQRAKNDLEHPAMVTDALVQDPTESGVFWRLPKKIIATEQRDIATIKRREWLQRQENFAIFKLNMSDGTEQFISYKKTSATETEITQNISGGNPSTTDYIKKKGFPVIPV